MVKRQLISIIVPCYNVEKYLDECVQSLLDQTYDNIEIILVDDGATDSTGEMCDEWAAKYENIIAVHKQNGGLSSARNAGMPFAKGDYIGFVDSDDYVAPDMYEKLASFMSDEVEVAMCTHIQAYEDENLHDDYQFSNDEIIEEPITFLRQYFYGDKYRLTNAVWQRLYSKRIAQTLEFPEDILYCEDIQYCVESMLMSKKVAFVDSPLYMYRIRSGSLCTSNAFSDVRKLDAMIEGEAKLYKRLAKLLVQKELDDMAIINYVRYIEIVLFAYCLLNYKKQQQLDIYKKVIELMPEIKSLVNYTPELKKNKKLHLFANRPEIYYRAWKIRNRGKYDEK